MCTKWVSLSNFLGNDVHPNLELYKFKDHVEPYGLVCEQVCERNALINCVAICDSRYMEKTS